MASIKLISGKYNEKLSSPNTRWVVLAEEKILFEVPEWIPQATVAKTGQITPVPDATLATPEVIMWKILDKSKKETLKTITSDVLQKLTLSVGKKLSGSYPYYLEASNSKGETALCSFSGNCEQKVTTASWSKKSNSSEQGELYYGSAFYITMETEGLNGDNVTLEIFSKKDDAKALFTTKEECINGEFTARCMTTSLVFVKDKKESEEFIVKLKNPAGKYIKKGSSETLLTFTVIDKTITPETEVPQNVTATKIGEPDKSTLSTGILSLEKVVVKTKYDVCNDGVISTSDYKNFWILEDKGKYYHWLKTRTNSDDTAKPNPIPITLTSTDKFSFTATFKTILPLDSVQIRIRDKDGKYIFANQTHPKKGKGDEHELKFSSTDTPYKDTVQYFSNFELIFDYSIDGSSWTPMGSVRFELYMTWKEPEWSSFDVYSTETMQIIHKGKNNIFETLLWLGCKQGSKLSSLTEESLIDKIFDDFKGLKVLRRREGSSYVVPDWSKEGLGYWRNKSAASGGGFTRGLRTLLRDGEARCGEWTAFFQHILLSQGIAVGNDTIGICTEYAVSKYGFPANPIIPDSYSKTSSSYKAIPLSYQFAVKNAIHIDVTDPSKTSGYSAGQGFPKTEPLFIDHFWFYYNKGKRFFDASYGVTYNSSDSNLQKYSLDNLNSVFLIDATGTKGSIETSKIHNYIRATKNLF